MRVEQKKATFCLTLLDRTAHGARDRSQEAAVLFLALE